MQQIFACGATPACKPCVAPLSHPAQSRKTDRESSPDFSRSARREHWSERPLYSGALSPLLPRIASGTEMASILIAEDAYARLISLPMFTAMSDQDVEDVIMCRVTKILHYYSNVNEGRRMSSFSGNDSAQQYCSLEFPRGPLRQRFGTATLARSIRIAIHTTLRMSILSIANTSELTCTAINRGFLLHDSERRDFSRSRLQRWQSVIASAANGIYQFVGYRASTLRP